MLTRRFASLDCCFCCAHHQVTDAKGDPLDFSRGKWLDFHRGIVAAPPKLHARLLEAVKSAEKGSS